MPRPAAALTLVGSTLKAKVVIDRRRASHDALSVRGEFRPADGSAPDPMTQAVRVTIGSFSQALSLGAFTTKVAKKKTTWTVKGPKLGLTTLKITKAGGTWAFTGTASGVSLAGTTNPVALGLQIGGDSGALTRFFVVADSAKRTTFRFPPRKNEDADRDGKSAAAGDCDDQDPTVFPGGPELCDGKDNDCDGDTDEGFALGASCSAGIGACRRDGVTICAPGGGTACSATPGLSTPERCGNQVDDDCDGETDEGFLLGVACTIGSGACRRGGVTICAADGTGTVCDAVPDPGCAAGPPIAIADPPNLSSFNRARVTVSGTVGPEAVEVRCNGVLADQAGGFSVTLTLEEGNDVIACVARDADGNVGTASVSVTVDTQAPRVTITAPQAGAMLTASPVTVTGLVNDIVVGTVNQQEARVDCNGVSAQIANRGFIARDVPLDPGLNTITCLGLDRAGNAGTARVEVTLAVPSGPALRLVSGEGQTGAVGTALPQPLVVEIMDGGAPLAGKAVLFQVQDNDGTLESGALAGRRVAAVTGADGRAQATYTLGTWAGAGSSRVRATAPGLPGEVLFSATPTPGPAAGIVLDSGGDQDGVVDQRLARPFVAVVIDARGNRLAGVPVTFAVLEGGGNLGGAAAVTVNADADGRAQAVLTLGSEEGIANDVVAATFAGNAGAAAVFMASGRQAGDPAQTRVSGVVLDNTDAPVPGVALNIEGTSLTAVADAQGQFRIAGVPIGPVRLIASGLTASRPGTWPAITFELVTLPGRDNTLPKPIYLLPLDVTHGLAVDETHGGTITLPDVPGFALTIAPGSATFADGARAGTVSVTMVHPDKVPMVPSFGQQPRFIVTIQPPGVRFDPPAPLTIPNADGLAPGEKTEMYSFDHDLGQFVGIGPGTASEDGTVIASDPGVGVNKGGWHSAGRPRLGGFLHVCDDGNECTSDEVRGLQCAHLPFTAEDQKPCATGAKVGRILVDCFGLDVVVDIDDSCQGDGGGMCDAGKCRGTSYDSSSIAAGAVAAVQKACHPGCVGQPLRDRMSFCLIDHGMKIKCLAEQPTGERANACAEATQALDQCREETKCSNEVSLYPLQLQRVCGGGDDSILFHEMVHAAGCATHVIVDGVLFEDKAYGCQEACFEHTSGGRGHIEDCH